MNKLSSRCRDTVYLKIVGKSPGCRPECGHLPMGGSTIIEARLSEDVNG